MLNVSGFFLSVYAQRDFFLNQWKWSVNCYGAFLSGVPFLTQSRSLQVPQHSGQSGALKLLGTSCLGDRKLRNVVQDRGRENAHLLRAHDGPSCLPSSTGTTVARRQAGDPLGKDSTTDTSVQRQDSQKQHLQWENWKDGCLKGH